MMIKNDIQNSIAFTGKERDGETGYGYFGARYMDHELMAMWLSVDPMSDKYPSISPYTYCAWNPVKLVDPDGNDWYQKGNDYYWSDKVNSVKNTPKGCRYIGNDNSLYSKGYWFNNNRPMTIPLTLGIVPSRFKHTYINK